MTRTMKAAVVRAFKEPLAIQEVPVPAPGAGQILVKIAASGVCHTDLHAADGDWPVKPKPPFIPGHEGVGHVAAVGAGVSHVKEGDRVGVPWLYTACGHCRHCLGGWETLCVEQQNTGYSVNGGFAEYVIADPNYVGHLPDKLSFVEIAPILCAGVTVYKGLKVTDTRPGDWVVVSGIGGLGHMAVQYAKAMGLNVIAVDVDDGKLDLARKLGASLGVNARKADPVAFREERGRWSAGRAGDRGFAEGLRAGDGHGWPRRNRFARRPAARRFPALHLQYRAERHHGARLDRRDAPRPSGSARLRRPGQGEGDGRHRAPREHQRHLFRMRAGDIQGRIVIDFQK